ncbi:cyclic diguanylate phosphodiesterase [Enterobacteriaceae bacterium BIT-l23]|uniref:EAL domain-containing protein n=1 Tax=Jejubacter sp. L23 TaxID=3092086 RepID=UPI001584EF3B|nr:cyclic diguanylate phosphodiesterase [Enterobacteriaceae bacterium BIT-l23]
MFTQQNERLHIAVRQLDTIIVNIERAARSASPLMDRECSPEIQHELRRLLALAPNVDSLELSSHDVIYCSSLTGRENQKMTDKNKLYLTEFIEEVPGHPYLVLRFGHGDSVVFASADGYYLRTILESASISLPVTFITPEGWMTQNGKVQVGRASGPFNMEVKSVQWPYRLASRLNSAAVFKIIISDGKSILAAILIASLFAGLGSYLWLGRRRPLAQQLQAAIRNNEIVPFIQPIVRSSDFKPIGGEVLARWVNQESEIPPEHFIPVAEQSHLLSQLTRSLIAQIADGLLDDFCPDKPFYLSFNVGASHFASQELTKDFSRLLQAAGQNIKLMLEITEREALIYDDNVFANVSRLKEMGVHLVLDDFGTGYSSLEYFQRISIDSIKIDKMFVQHLGEDPVCNHIVANVTDLSSRLGLEVIAEGVETESQAEYLRETGVASLQGYLFSRPLSLVGFKKYIRNYV